jgi:hypothetical protein
LLSLPPLLLAHPEHTKTSAFKTRFSTTDNSLESKRMKDNKNNLTLIYTSLARLILHPIDTYSMSLRINADIRPVSQSTHDICFSIKHILRLKYTSEFDINITSTLYEAPYEFVIHFMQRPICFTPFCFNAPC